MDCRLFCQAISWTIADLLLTGITFSEISNQENACENVVCKRGQFVQTSMGYASLHALNTEGPDEETVPASIWGYRWRYHKWVGHVIQTATKPQ